MKPETSLLPILGAILACALCLSIPAATAAGPLVADHSHTNLSLVPVSAVEQAKGRLHIAYGHTSHGSQVTTGMTGLTLFKNAPHGGSLYQWNSGGTGGALDLRDAPFFGARDLGNPDRIAWAAATRQYLDAHPEVNVVMWSWCGQVSSASVSDIATYLNLMSQLESEYPAVMFVYMTGHLDGSGESGRLNQRNEQIRAYVRANNKTLFDFADIESYDPDGNYYLDRGADDGCNYDGGNWATEWQEAHEEGVDWFSCAAAHTQPLNANLKAAAAWWLWARLGGWDGTAETGEILPLPGYSSPPSDPDGDGLHEDLNANGRLDFADVVLYFSHMTWMAQNEPAGLFDFNGSGRIDFGDIVRLFGLI